MVITDLVGAILTFTHTNIKTVIVSPENARGALISLGAD